MARIGRSFPAKPIRLRIPASVSQVDVSYVQLSENVSYVDVSYVGVSQAASVSANAGCATASGSANQPSVSLKPTAGVATSTGTANAATVTEAARGTQNILITVVSYNATPRIQIPIGLASGVGAANAPNAKLNVNASTATASAAANDATVSIVYPDVDANAGVATGTGTSNNAAPSVAANAGCATASGTANPGVPSINSNASVASSTGTAYPGDVTEVGIDAEAAGGAGTANNAAPWVQPQAGVASGTGTANNATVVVSSNAGIGTSTGTANTGNSSVAPNATTATSSGVANNATAQVEGVTNAFAGVASATGTANDPDSSVSVTAATSTASASGNNGSVSEGVNSGSASVTGSANEADVSIRTSAGVANASGSSVAATTNVAANAGVAAASGVANDGDVPAAGVFATTADSSGSANNASVAVYANAGCATAIAVSNDPDVGVKANASVATASGVANNATRATNVYAYAGVATGIGRPRNARVRIPDVLNNNDFENAYLLSGTAGSVEGTNIDYDVQDLEPSLPDIGYYFDTYWAPHPYASGWFKYSPPDDGYLTLDFRDSTFDVIATVYEGSSFKNLQLVGYGDEWYGEDGEFASGPIVKVVVQKDHTYYISVDGYWDDWGTYRFDWSLDTSRFLPGDRWEDAIPLVLDDHTVVGTTVGHSTQSGEPNFRDVAGALVASTWYKVTIGPNDFAKYPIFEIYSNQSQTTGWDSGIGMSFYKGDSLGNLQPVGTSSFGQYDQWDWFTDANSTLVGDPGQGSEINGIGLDEGTYYLQVWTPLFGVPDTFTLKTTIISTFQETRRGSRITGTSAGYRLPDMPVARQYATAVSINGYQAYVGGETPRNSEPQVLIRDEFWRANGGIGEPEIGTAQYEVVAGDFELRRGRLFPTQTTWSGDYWEPDVWDDASIVLLDPGIGRFSVEMRYFIDDETVEDQNSQIGFVFHYQDENNYWAWGGPGGDLFRREGGVVKAIGRGSGFQWVDRTHRVTIDNHRFYVEWKADEADDSEGDLWYSIEDQFVTPDFSGETRFGFAFWNTAVGLDEYTVYTHPAADCVELKSIDVWDPIGNGWTNFIPDLPEPRAEAAVVAFNPNPGPAFAQEYLPAVQDRGPALYVIGGRYRGVAQNQTWRWSWGASSWETLDPMPTARYGAAATLRLLPVGDRYTTPQLAREFDFSSASGWSSSAGTFDVINTDDRVNGPPTRRGNNVLRFTVGSETNYAYFTSPHIPLGPTEILYYKVAANWNNYGSPINEATDGYGFAAFDRRVLTYVDGVLIDTNSWNFGGDLVYAEDYLYSEDPYNYHELRRYSDNYWDCCWDFGGDIGSRLTNGHNVTYVVEFRFYRGGGAGTLKPGDQFFLGDVFAYSHGDQFYFSREDERRLTIQVVGGSDGTLDAYGREKSMFANEALIVETHWPVENDLESLHKWRLLMPHPQPETGWRWVERGFTQEERYLVGGRDTIRYWTTSEVPGGAGMFSSENVFIVNGDFSFVVPGNLYSGANRSKIFRFDSGVVYSYTNDEHEDYLAACIGGGFERRNPRWMYYTSYDDHVPWYEIESRKAAAGVPIFLGHNPVVNQSFYMETEIAAPGFGYSVVGGGQTPDGRVLKDFFSYYASSNPFFRVPTSANITMKYRRLTPLAPSEGPPTVHTHYWNDRSTENAIIVGWSSTGNGNSSPTYQPPTDGSSLIMTIVTTGYVNSIPGWTYLYSNSGNECSYHIFSRTADSEPNTYTVSISNSGSVTHIGLIAVLNSTGTYRGNYYYGNDFQRYTTGDPTAKGFQVPANTLQLAFFAGKVPSGGGFSVGSPWTQVLGESRSDGDFITGYVYQQTIGAESVVPDVTADSHPGVIGNPYYTFAGQLGFTSVDIQSFQQIGLFSPMAWEGTMTESWQSLEFGPILAGTVVDVFRNGLSAGRWGGEVSDTWQANYRDTPRGGMWFFSGKHPAQDESSDPQEFEILVEWEAVGASSGVNTLRETAVHNAVEARLINANETIYLRPGTMVAPLPDNAIVPTTSSPLIFTDADYPPDTSWQ